MSEKTQQFIGRVTIIETKYGALTKIAFGPKDFELLETIKNNGWANFVLKQSKEGKPYLVVDDWKPQVKSEVGNILDNIGKEWSDSKVDIADVPF